MYIPMRCDLSDDGVAPCCNVQRFSENRKVGRQVTDPDTSAMLSRSQITNPRLSMLMVDRFLQTQRFPFEPTDLGLMALEQAWLKPGMEIFHGSIELGTIGRDQQQFAPKAQGQALHLGRIISSQTPSYDLDCIVELDLLWQTDVLRHSPRKSKPSKTSLQMKM